MKVSLMEMTVVIGGCTFHKVIGKDERVYAENYGQYIPETESVNTFQELIAAATKFLEEDE